MARPLRLEFPGATHHVTSRGNERRDIFLSDEDRLAFLRFLAIAARRFGWVVTAWVLMTNHFHLVIRTPQPNLSRGMQWLNGAYAGWFNARHRRVGHLFQGRFKSVLVEEETYFARLLRYVVLNPVRAGMVSTPEHDRWSSFRATAGLEAAPDWLDVGAALEPFGGEGAIAEARYRSFVLDPIGLQDPLWEQLVHGMFLGSEDWTKRMRAEVERKPRSTDHPKVQRAVGRPKMLRWWRPWLALEGRPSTPSVAAAATGCGRSSPGSAGTRDWSRCAASPPRFDCGARGTSRA